MSDCRHGGRDVYQKFASGFNPPRDNAAPRFKRCEITIVYSDGTTLTDPRNLVWEDGTERHVVAVLIDGERWVKERSSNA